MWLIVNVLGLISNYGFSIFFENNGAEDYLILATYYSMLANGLTIAGTLLTIKFRKAGFYMIVIAAFSYFVAVVMIEGVFAVILTHFMFWIYFLLFFFVKKDGFTAYNIIFSKKLLNNVRERI